MSKTVSTLRPGGDHAPGQGTQLSAELELAFAEVAELAREGLLAMSVCVGLRVMAEMMESELTGRVGPKHARIPERTASRHASAPGSVVLGGRRVPVSRPWARTVDGAEVQLETYATFASDELLTQVVLERMLAGVATRRHRAVAEPIGRAVEAEASSTSRSAVSRRFKAATASALEELMSRGLSELAVAAMMIDGVVFAEHCCVVALAICTDGTKAPVGLWLGDTENKTVVTHLLSDVCDRGLDASGGILSVIDGSKALAAGVRKVVGEAALVQRCTLHKRGNVTDHLPKDQQRFIDAKLAKAFAGRPAGGQAAGQAPRGPPPGRGGQPEGGLGGHVHRAAPRYLRPPGPHPDQHQRHRVDDLHRPFHERRREALARREMIKRWVAAGMLNAERSFRRVKGCKDMPTLAAALASHVKRRCHTLMSK